MKEAKKKVLLSLLFWRQGTQLATLSMLFPNHSLHWMDIWRFLATIRISILGAICSLLLIIFFDVGIWARTLLVIFSLVAIVGTILFYNFLLDLDKKEGKNQNQASASVSSFTITPLLQAVIDGNLEKVQATLAEHPEQLNIAYAPNGNTPLHVAALNGKKEIMEFLLAQPGIDKDRKNNDGKTAFDLAAKSGGTDFSN